MTAGHPETIRPAAVAGSFYPDRADTLRQTLLPLLSAEQRHPRPRALILPHAGHGYCAAIAAEGVRRLHGHPIQRVAIICPTHRVAINGAALPSVSQFATPLGTVPLDREAVATVAPHPGIIVSDAVHAQEHAIEVLLPYLQLVLGAFTLLPIAAGNIDPDHLADALQPLWRREDVLFVISSDLSHFHPYDRANRIDAATCDAIAAGRDISHEQACGATGINTLQRLRQPRQQPLQLLAYCNSGDSGGGKESVVGYASFCL